MTGMTLRIPTLTGMLPTSDALPCMLIFLEYCAGIVLTPPSIAAMYMIVKTTRAMMMAIASAAFQAAFPLTNCL